MCISRWTIRRQVRSWNHTLTNALNTLHVFNFSLIKSPSVDLDSSRSIVARTTDKRILSTTKKVIILDLTDFSQLNCAYFVGHVRVDL